MKLSVEEENKDVEKDGDGDGSIEEDNDKLWYMYLANAENSNYIFRLYLSSLKFHGLKIIY